MRKTVHEWLAANENGKGIAKKKSARRKLQVNDSIVPPTAMDVSAVADKRRKKKQVTKTSSRKPKPR